MKNHLIKERKRRKPFNSALQDPLTFRKVIKFSVRCKAHVLLCREAAAVKHMRPRVTLAGQDWSTAVPHCHTETVARLDKTEGRPDERLQTEDEAREIFAGREGLPGLWKNVLVETDGSDEGAEKGLGLRVAACLQQGPPVLRAWNHLTFQVAVTQKIRQPHLGVSHTFADPHLVGNGDAAGGLAHVERQQGRCQSQESGEVQSHGLQNPQDGELRSAVPFAAAAAFIYRQQRQPHQPASLLSTIYQSHRDDVFGDNSLFCEDCRQRGGIRQMEGV